MSIVLYRAAPLDTTVDHRQDELEIGEPAVSIFQAERLPLERTMHCAAGAAVRAMAAQLVLCMHYDTPPHGRIRVGKAEMSWWWSRTRHRS